MNLIEKLNWRYAAKRMNGTTVPEEKVALILEAIRLSPTSLGFHAFKVYVIENPQLKEKIFNEACHQPQIKESSHLLVFTPYRNISTELVKEHMEFFSKTRAVELESLSYFDSQFSKIIDQSEEQNFNWTTRQSYIALGFGIVAAALEGVDATPIEGFNPVVLDEILNLKDQNLSSVCILALGYRDEATDYLHKAKKVRRSKEDMFVLRK